MKKIIFSSLLIVFAIGSFAQGGKAKANASTPEQRAERITNWMNKKLTLTADQKTKIYDVNLKYAKMNQETRTSEADDQKAMHQDLRANEKEREAEFQGILTPEQFQSFQTAKKELIERRIDRKRKR